MAKNQGKQTPTTVAGDDGEAHTQLATRVPVTLHRNVKLHCVGSGQAVMAFVIDALREKLEREQATTGRRAAGGRR